MLEGKRILVTGGAGFIGSHIAERLCVENDVVVYDDLSAGRESNLSGFDGKVDFVRGDVRDSDALGEAVRGVNVAFHCAARVSVTESVEDPIGTSKVNVGGTLRLLWESKKAGVERVVFPSSAAVYGSSPEIPKREDMQPDADSPYAASKIVGEQYCRLFTKVYDLPTVILRCFNVYGPRQDVSSPYASVIPRFVTAIAKGDRPQVFGDGKQTRDFVYVEDVVDAFTLAATTTGTEGETFNVASGEGTSILDLIDHVAGIIGSKAVPEFLPERPGDVKHSLADVSRAGSKLGFAPRVGHEEGLRRTVDHFMSLH
ncbi:MAG: NAD-dependent epimerase/dehydratase family protein [Candidatus Thermoplasmatota archaeon]|nr:NAD-dependent epimerase/dehydratase family protein [Candidatus Thermoplasmatota archaeon]